MPTSAATGPPASQLAPVLVACTQLALLVRLSAVHATQTCFVSLVWLGRSGLTLTQFSRNSSTFAISVLPCNPALSCRSYQRVTSARVRWLHTSQGNSIISAFVPYQDGRGNAARLTLLYSHGNAVDLGQMLPVYK